MVRMNSLLFPGNKKSNSYRLLVVIVVAVVTGKQFVAAGPPNVVVILVDDLGYGDLSSYGATDLKSPHIDMLVSRGMKFSNFYANCPVCSPHTGIAPHRPVS